ncbi:unnamed protein product [Fusarium langsethiae]|nr:unnamed protein product [Fusarium langsethiae]
MREQYWFDTFYQVLETLRALPVTAAESIQISDWTMLASSLGREGYTATDVNQLFYPKKVNDNNNDNDDDKNSQGTASPNAKSTTKTPRRGGLLVSLDREAYDHVFRYLGQNLTLRFPDVQPLLKMKKEEGEIMVKIMGHVVYWINHQPADIVGLHENNKPLRRKDLIPAIDHLMTTAYGNHWWAQLRDNGDVDSTDDVTSWLDLRSRALEREVLDYVRSHMTRFRDPSTKHYIDLMPDEHDENYRGLLRTVQDFIGPAFRPVWQGSVLDRVGVDDETRRSSQPETRRRPASAITRAICSQLGNIPEVRENPALSGVYASTELGPYIDRAVLTWASDRCLQAVEKSESDDGAPWSNEALQIIRRAYQDYKKLLSQMTATAVIPANDGTEQWQQPSLPLQDELISQFPDEHPQQDPLPLNQRVKQPSTSQRSVPIHMMVDEGKGHDRQTREMAREQGLLRMRQQQERKSQQQRQQQHQSSQLSVHNTIMSSPSRPATSASRNPRREEGTQIRNGMDHVYQTPSRQHHPAAGASRSSQELPTRSTRGIGVVHPRAVRVSLPNGQPKPSRPHTTREERHHRSYVAAKSQPPNRCASWMDGPVATSGSRR